MARDLVPIRASHFEKEYMPTKMILADIEINQEIVKSIIKEQFRISVPSISFSPSEYKSNACMPCQIYQRTSRY